MWKAWIWSNIKLTLSAEQKKDFIDLYYLLKCFSIQDLFNFYLEKFDDGNLFLVKKSLTYFDDAEPDPMPIMKENITWKEIKEYLKINALSII
ncbi:MAG TPA: hypothetical protein P5509_09350 [Bacteroidales bacterium]|jgi:hypothetical protein|nr:hypothetical protein [Bacteroidales bacterium]